MSTSLFHPFGLYITLHQVFINSNFNVFNVFSLSYLRKKASTPNNAQNISKEENFGDDA